MPPWADYLDGPKPGSDKASQRQNCVEGSAVKNSKNQGAAVSQIPASEVVKRLAKAAYPAETEKDADSRKGARKRVRERIRYARTTGKLQGSSGGFAFESIFQWTESTYGREVAQKAFPEISVSCGVVQAEASEVTLEVTQELSEACRADLLCLQKNYDALRADYRVLRRQYEALLTRYRDLSADRDRCAKELAELRERREEHRRKSGERGTWGTE